MSVSVSDTLLGRASHIPPMNRFASALNVNFNPNVFPFDLPRRISMMSEPLHFAYEPR